MLPAHGEKRLHMTDKCVFMETSKASDEKNEAVVMQPLIYILRFDLL